MTRRSVVTGGGGFVGSHLVDALLERGDEVIVVDNLVGSGGSDRNIAHALRHPRLVFFKEDLLDWASPGALAGVDTVFHQAASKNTVSLRDPERDLAVNAQGTLRLILGSVSAGVRKFIHGSTGSVFGELQERQDESHPTRPRSFYGVSKLAAEGYCRVAREIYGLNFTVLRYYHVIGPRQDDSDSGGVVPIFIRRCEEGRPITIFGTGEQVRSFTSVDDVVRANLLVADDSRTEGEFYNCASAIKVSIQELAEFVKAEMSSDVPLVYDEWRPGDIVNFDIDNRKIRSIGAKFNRDWKEVVRWVIASRAEDLASLPGGDRAGEPSPGWS